MKAAAAQNGTKSGKVQREVLLGLPSPPPYFKDSKDFSMFADKEENMPLGKEESLMMPQGNRGALGTKVTERASREAGLLL